MKLSAKQRIDIAVDATEIRYKLYDTNLDREAVAKFSTACEKIVHAVRFESYGDVPAAVTEMANVPAKAFVLDCTLASLMCAVDRIERNMGLSPCLRNLGLTERDDTGKSRFDQIWNRAEREHYEAVKLREMAA